MLRNMALLCLDWLKCSTSTCLSFLYRAKMCVSDGKHTGKNLWKYCEGYNTAKLSAPWGSEDSTTSVIARNRGCSSTGKQEFNRKFSVITRRQQTTDYSEAYTLACMWRYNILPDDSHRTSLRPLRLTAGVEAIDHVLNLPSRCLQDRCTVVNIRFLFLILI